MSHTRVITVANAKGGIGKTLVSTHLASALALAGRKTLLVDAEPQRNAAEVLLAGTESDPYGDGISDYLLSKDVPLPATVVSTRLENLDVVRPGLDLEEAERWMGTQRLAETVFARRVIDPLVAYEAYDVIVVDTPPSMREVTLGAMLATVGRGGVVIPARVTDSNVIGGIRDIRGALSDLEPFGQVATLGVVLLETGAGASVTQREVREALTGVRSPIVGEWRFSEAFRTATTKGLTLQEWRAKSPAAGEVAKTAKTVWTRAKGIK